MILDRIRTLAYISKSARMNRYKLIIWPWVLLSLSGCTTDRAVDSLAEIHCRLSDEHNRRLTESFLVRPSRNSKLVRLTDNTYANIHIRPLSSEVGISIISAPHHPWTFGEKGLGAGVLQLDDRVGFTRRTVVVFPNGSAVLECARGPF
jgi:hypothetical protein